MSEFNGEQLNGNDAEGTNRDSQPAESEEQTAVSEPVEKSEEKNSQIHQFFHSQFGGISNIWPSSVCGH